MATMYDNKSPAELAKLAALYGKRAVFAPGAAARPAPNSALDKPLAKGDVDQVTKLADAARAGNSMAQTTASFMRKNADTDTGPWNRIPGVQALLANIPGLAERIGLEGQQNLPAMQRDATVMATQLRPKGDQMAASEFSKYLASSPSLGSGYEANKPIRDTVYRARTLVNAESAFKRAWLDNNHSLKGADVAWLKFQTDNFTPDGEWRPKGREPVTALPKATVQSTQAATQAGRTPPPPSEGSYVDINGKWHQ
jgi:hypothetical protein